MHDSRMPETSLSCTLDAADRSARLVAARALGERALVAVNVSERRARLRFHGEPERVDALVAAERACCGFLELKTTRHGEDTDVEIRTPEGGEPILRALVAGIVAGWGQRLGSWPAR
jgi:hypothetical protein